MPRHLSKEELSEAEECFTIFSKDGRLQTNDLGIVLRSLGFNPSNADVDVIVRELGAPSTLTFSVLKDVLAKDLPPPNTAEEVREAFGIFDQDGTGTIQTAELKHILMSTGEGLSEDEVNLMIREAHINSDGEINYEQFVQVMTRK